MELVTNLSRGGHDFAESLRVVCYRQEIGMNKHVEYLSRSG
jgi:hypothetical protein